MFIIRTQWGSINKLCSPMADMEGSQKLAIYEYWGGGIWRVCMVQDTELDKGCWPLGPGGAGLSLCCSSSTIEHNTITHKNVISNTRAFAFSKPQILCFPFRTIQSRLFPWFSISGPLSESRGEDSEEREKPGKELGVFGWNFTPSMLGIKLASSPC